MDREVFFNTSAVLAVFLFGLLVVGLVLNLGPLNTQTLNELPCQNLFAQPVKNFIRESPNMGFVQENTLIGICPPLSVSPQVLGSILGGGEDGFGSESGNGIVEYIIEQGDSLSSIAEKFNISLETILWANELSSKSLVKLGQKLIIPPVSGVIYHVKQGDTISEISQVYKAKAEEIVSFNELSDENDIFIGDILIIPNGKMPLKPSPTYIAQIPIGSSYFICPTTSCHITQGLHWYNAIDFGGKCGDPIYAAAGGTVQRVDYGWNGGAGNYIRVLHPNGVVTMYGHIQTGMVLPGQQVSQGEIIALVGGQPGTSGAGKSTGCHVHFDVRGSRNPFAK